MQDGRCKDLKEEQALTGVKVVTSLTEAIKRSVEEKKDNHVAVVPEGPYVISLYRPGNKPGDHV